MYGVAVVINSNIGLVVSDDINSETAEGGMNDTPKPLAGKSIGTNGLLTIIDLKDSAIFSISNIKDRKVSFTVYVLIGIIIATLS